MLYQLSGTVQADSRFWGPRLFQEYRIWVSYELGENLPYLLNYIGEDHIVVGTDYGHHAEGTTNRLASDPSAQIHMVRELRSRTEHYERTIEKLLVDNPHALYGVA